MFPWPNLCCPRQTSFYWTSLPTIWILLPRKFWKQPSIIIRGTVLYVSHDRYFINKTATRILDLTHEQILSYDGDYNYYLEKKDTVESIHIQEDTATPVSSGKAETSSKTDWKAQKELEAKKRKVENAARQAEETIAALEQDMENIDEEIALPENATNVGRLTELSREKEEKEAALTETMEQWEQLMEQLESF